jgi:multimeric flavodoxin WrbA
MKALILNGSPRGPKSVTGRLLQSLEAGLTSGGADVRRFSVCAMKIAPCSGCLSCMHKTPGECAIKDDMEEIYARLKVSDVLIIGAPVYVDNMSSPMKAVMDRSVACLQPFLVKDKTGRIRHPFNWRMPGRFLLVSTSGFPETVTFDPLVAVFRAGAANFGAEPIGEVLLPGSIALQVQPDILEGHLGLIEEMGKGLAETDRIDDDLLKRINTPPLSVDEYLKIAASYESWCREHVGAKEKMS